MSPLARGHVSEWIPTSSSAVSLHLEILEQARPEPPPKQFERDVRKLAFSDRFTPVFVALATSRNTLQVPTGLLLATSQ